MWIHAHTRCMSSYSYIIGGGGCNWIMYDKTWQSTAATWALSCSKINQTQNFLCAVHPFPSGFRESGSCDAITAAAAAADDPCIELRCIESFHNPHIHTQKEIERQADRQVNIRTGKLGKNLSTLSILNWLTAQSDIIYTYGSIVCNENRVRKKLKWRYG